MSIDEQSSGYDPAAPPPPPPSAEPKAALGSGAGTASRPDRTRRDGASIPGSLGAYRSILDA